MVTLLLTSALLASQGADLKFVPSGMTAKMGGYRPVRAELGTDKAGVKIEELSKGNQQKVQIAAALLSNPEIVILDEPFSYPDGPLVAVSTNNWITHSGSTGQVQVISGGACLNEANSEDVNYLLRGQPYSASSGLVLYVGMKVNFDELHAFLGTVKHDQDRAPGRLLHERARGCKDGHAYAAIVVRTRPDRILADDVAHAIVILM